MPPAKAAATDGSTVMPSIASTTTAVSDDGSLAVARGRCASTAKVSAQVAVSAAIGPTWSTHGTSAAQPSEGTAPCDGLKPTTPHHEAGMRIDPAVSVPSPISNSPVTMPAAEPPDDPPATRPGSCGFPTVPYQGFCDDVP